VSEKLNKTKKNMHLESQPANMNRKISTVVVVAVVIVIVVVALYKK